MRRQPLNIKTAIRLIAVFSLLTAKVSPSFCQDSVFRPGDQVIARDITFLKISPKSSSPILAVLENNESAIVIDSQSIWIRVSGRDGGAQGWAKDIEFEIETQQSAPDTLSKSISVYAGTKDTSQKHEQAVPSLPQLQKEIRSKSGQGMGIWGIIISIILSAFFGGMLVFFFQRMKHKQRPPTKINGEGMRKFNELMIAYEGIETAQKKLLQSMSGNGYEHWQMLFEELSDAYNQLAVLQKKSLNDIEYLQQEIEYLQEEHKISR